MANVAEKGTYNFYILSLLYALLVRNTGQHPTSPLPESLFGLESIQRDL